MRDRFNTLITYAERRPLAPLLLILLLGLAGRALLLPTSGFDLDLEQHYYWGLCGVENGVFGVYNCWPEVTHPPVSPTLLTAGMGALQTLGIDTAHFDGNSAVAFILKLPNLLFEIGIVALVYWIMLKRYGLRWAIGITAALNFNPGWVIVTSWWGQNDASYSFFIVLAAYALTEKRPRWLWAAYALAWLAKFQSIMFLPVLVVFTLRRHGWHALLEGLVLYAVIFLVGFLPFYLGSGEDALNPFVGTVGLFPYISTGMFNMWFWISGSSPAVILDSTPFIAGLTYFQAGFLLLTVGEALLCLRVWLLPEREDVFLVMATANLSFVILPTQIQIRYLYPGLIFLALAMAHDRRLMALYVGFSITFLYNVLRVVQLSIGLLYYPYKLMIWTPTQSALAVTAFYLLFMALFIQPMWQVRHEFWQRLNPRFNVKRGAVVQS